MQPQPPLPGRSARRLPRVAFLPALAGALVPKCPVCVAAWLSAFGAGASAAQGAAPLIVRVGNGLLALAVSGLGVCLVMRVSRSHRYGALALFALSAGALLALTLAAPMPAWARLVPLPGLVVAVLRADAAR